MIDPPPPSLKDRLAEPVVRDRDAAFSDPFARKIRRERRRVLLAGLIWRVAIIASIGLLLVAVVVGMIYMTRLVPTSIGG